MKIFGQLEKAQLENTTADTASQPKGFATYRTDTNVAKVSNGTVMKELVDTDSAQTLTSKSLTTPAITSPVITGSLQLNEIATPATPAAGLHKFYYKTDGLLYTLDSTGNEIKVGSGSGGGAINLITNGTADDAAVSIFTPYLNTAQSRPVTGTGGAPTVTTSLTSTIPLSGTKSFLLTKPATNTQGQGWTVLTQVLQPEYRAKSLKISASYIVNSGTFVAGNNSGTPSDGDVIWYLRDNTNSKLVEPSNIKMFSSSSTISDKFEASVQFDFDCTSFSLIAHCASTSALAYELKIDSVTVSPQNYVYASPKTDFVLQSTAPVLTGSTSGTLVVGTGGGAINTVEVARDGQEILARYNFRRGTTGFVDVVGALVFPLPLGYSTVLSQFEIIGYGDITVVGTANPAARVVAKIFTGGFILDASDAGLVNSAGGLYATNANSISIVIRFKAVGLSSSVQMSDSADTRVVEFKTTGAAISGINPNNSSVKVQVNTVLSDSTGAWDTTLKRYIVNSAGKYRFDATISLNSANITNNYYNARIFINGTDMGAPGSGGLTPAASFIGSNISTGSINLKSGDYVELFLFSGANHSVSTIIVDTAFLSGHKIQGPQAIAASEAINCRYYNSSTSITSALATIAWSTKDYDSHGSMVSGTYTTNTAGKFNVNAELLFSGTFILNNTSVIEIQKNGSVVSRSTEYAGGAITQFKNWITDDINCLAGDTIRIQASSTGTAVAVVSSNFDNFITIKRVG